VCGKQQKALSLLSIDTVTREVDPDRVGAAAKNRLSLFLAYLGGSVSSPKSAVVIRRINPI